MRAIYLSLLLLFNIVFYCSAQYITDGYFNKTSYNVGEVFNSYLKGNIPASSIGILELEDINGIFQMSIFDIQNFISLHLMNSQTIQNMDPWMNGYGYSFTGSWVVPSLKSGVYFLQHKVPLIIKGNNNTADIVVVCPTNTINAYTNSGGKSLYDYNSFNGVPATTVSFHRPQDFTYGYMSGFLSWLDGTNYNVNVIADMDMEDYSEIQNAKVLIVIGHSEYWTRQARINFNRFVDSGKDAIILSGNSFWWQVQYIDENYGADNTKLTAYKGTTDQIYNPTLNPTADASCDPLLKTVQWNEPSLKYSILGSIGADFGDGQQNHANYGEADVCHGGFHGHKILLPNSPLLTGTGLIRNSILTFPTGEYDRTLISALDVNGDPILDITALGFYKADLIGYDGNTSSGIMEYYPFMAFQRTCSSGKIINVSSNYWCKDQGIGGWSRNNPCTGLLANPDAGDMRIITKNMIDLLLAGSNIFVSPAPTAFRLTPSSNNVSYSSCTTNGSIRITPCGVFLDEGTGISGYKVDRKDGYAVAKIEDCTSCNHAARGTATLISIQETFTSNNNQKEENLLKEFQEFRFNISPNPSNGFFNVRSDVIINKIDIINVLGESVYSGQINSREAVIDLSKQQNGIYFLQLKTEQVMIVKKIILNH